MQCLTFRGIAQGDGIRKEGLLGGV
jgi:hypothetical protein